MLSREELNHLNTIFWSGFKDQMKKTPSSNGRRMNWINYPSDVKDIYIRLEADAKGARMCFDIQPKDESVRSIIWEQMNELKRVLEEHTTYPSEWIEHYQMADGRMISRICWKDDALNFYHTDHHQAIYAFFKDRLVEFDQFYQQFKDILILLVN